MIADIHTKSVIHLENSWLNLYTYRVDGYSNNYYHHLSYLMYHTKFHLNKHTVRALDKMRKINFNRRLLRYFLSKSYVCPLVRIVSMILSRNKHFRNKNTHLIWSPAAMPQIFKRAVVGLLRETLREISGLFLSVKRAIMAD